MIALAIEGLVLVIFVITCMAIASRILCSGSLLREFGVTSATGLLPTGTIMLYIPPILSALISSLFPEWFFHPLPLAALFFIPHLLLVRKPINRLERAGTSRVEKIARPLRDSVWLGVGGVLYICIIWVLGLVLNALYANPR